MNAAQGLTTATVKPHVLTLKDLIRVPVGRDTAEMEKLENPKRAVQVTINTLSVKGDNLIQNIFSLKLRF